MNHFENNAEKKTKCSELPWELFGNYGIMDILICCDRTHDQHKSRRRRLGKTLTIFMKDFGKVNFGTIWRQ